MIITPRPWPPPPPKETLVRRYDPGHFVQRHAMPYDFDLWVRVQERDNAWLGSQLWVVGWETNPPNSHFDREETIVWINDKKYATEVPKQLFGLPTTVFLSEDVYEGMPYRTIIRPAETLLRRNFTSRWSELVYNFKAYIKKLS